MCLVKYFNYDDWLHTIHLPSPTSYNPVQSYFICLASCCTQATIQYLFMTARD